MIEKPQKYQPYHQVRYEYEYKYEYLASEEILPFNPRRMIKQTIFTWKRVLKTDKDNGRSREKQVKVLKVLKPYV